MKKKYGDLINLRAIAILMVMFGHSIILYSSKWSLYEPANQSPFFDYIKRFIDAIQMPLFFSLSGYLYVFTCKKYTFRTMLIDKVKRLLIPYIMVSSLYMVPIRMLLKYNGYAGMSYFSVLLEKIVLGGDNGHLWYLPALFLIFVGIGIYFIIIDKQKIKCTVAYIILLAAGVFLNYFRNVFHSGITFLSNAQMYLLYFFEGYLICIYKDKIDFAKSIKTGRVITFILFSAVSGASIYLNKTNFVISVTLVICTYILIPRNTNRVMEFIDKNSFGLYLFHSPLIYFMFVYMPDINPWMFALIGFVGLGSIALGITLFIRKIGLGIEHQSDRNILVI